MPAPTLQPTVVLGRLSFPRDCIFRHSHPNPVLVASLDEFERHLCQEHHLPLSHDASLVGYRLVVSVGARHWCPFRHNNKGSSSSEYNPSTPNAPATRTPKVMLDHLQRCAAQHKVAINIRESSHEENFDSPSPDLAAMTLALPEDSLAAYETVAGVKGISAWLETLDRTFDNETASPTSHCVPLSLGPRVSLPDLPLPPSIPFYEILSLAWKYTELKDRQTWESLYCVKSENDFRRFLDFHFQQFKHFQSFGNIEQSDSLPPPHMLPESGYQSASQAALVVQEIDSMSVNHTSVASSDSNHSSMQPQPAQPAETEGRKTRSQSARIMRQSVASQ